MVKRTRMLCTRGGLRLHKFTSNSKTVLKAIPEDDLAKGLKNLDLRQNALPMERALGVQWCMETDTFQFRITLQDKPLTRHGILSMVSSIYDPLGFLLWSPSEENKFFLKQLCGNRMSLTSKKSKSVSLFHPMILS